MSKHLYDFIVVGQGLAGSLLGYWLEQQGQRCLFIDNPQQVASSDVAAGIINPITGRHFVKSWRVDDLLPFAEATYRQLETELGISFYHPRTLLRVLAKQGDENDWLARTGDPAYAPYMAETAKPGAYKQHAAPCYAYGETLQAAQVDLAMLTAALRKRWQQQDQWLAEDFDYQQLQLSDSGVVYGRFEARQLVFCEGWRLKNNPYFNYLPLQGNKGEVLIVSFPEVAFEKMLKQQLFVVPLTDGRCWIGSTSDNHFESDAPSAKGLAYLSDGLRDLMKIPYTLLDHRSAVRPTVRDRRPLLGRHPEHPALAVFNGLGTKGASLGPYWAKHIADHLLHGSSLDKEVDIARWEAHKNKP